MALLNCSENARQHRVRLGAAVGAVSPADLSCYDGWAQGLLSAPVGGVDRIGFEQKRKHGREFNGEMGREAACNVFGAGLIDQRVEVVLQMPASDCEPVRGDSVSLIAVSHRSACRRTRWTRGAKWRSR